MKTSKNTHLALSISLILVIIATTLTSCEKDKGIVDESDTMVIDSTRYWEMDEMVFYNEKLYFLSNNQLIEYDTLEPDIDTIPLDFEYVPFVEKLNTFQHSTDSDLFYVTISNEECPYLHSDFRCMTFGFDGKLVSSFSLNTKIDEGQVVHDFIYDRGIFYFLIQEIDMTMSIVIIDDLEDITIIPIDEIVLLDDIVDLKFSFQGSNIFILANHFEQLIAQVHTIDLTSFDLIETQVYNHEYGEYYINDCSVAFFNYDNLSYIYSRGGSYVELDIMDSTSINTEETSYLSWYVQNDHLGHDIKVLGMGSSYDVFLGGNQGVVVHEWSYYVIIESNIYTLKGNELESFHIEDSVIKDDKIYILHSYGLNVFEVEGFKEIEVVRF